MDDLREDEMEALLKFDGAKLRVVSYDDLVSRMDGQTYVALITINNKNFMGAGESRIEAIRNAWEVYQRYMVTPVEDRYNGYWLYENALANVEVQLWKNTTGETL